MHDPGLLLPPAGCVGESLCDEPALLLQASTIRGRGPDSFRYQAESAWADSQGTVYRAGVQVELG